jgi:hypothetical protein
MRNKLLDIAIWILQKLTSMINSWNQRGRNQ